MAERPFDIETFETIDISDLDNFNCEICWKRSFISLHSKTFLFNKISKSKISNNNKQYVIKVKEEEENWFLKISDNAGFNMASRRLQSILSGPIISMYGLNARIQR